MKNRVTDRFQLIKNKITNIYNYNPCNFDLRDKESAQVSFYIKIIGLYLLRKVAIYQRDLLVNLSYRVYGKCDFIDEYTSKPIHWHILRSLFLFFDFVGDWTLHKADKFFMSYRNKNE